MDGHFDVAYFLRKLTLHLTTGRYHHYLMPTPNKLVREIYDVSFHAANIKFRQNLYYFQRNITSFA